MTHPVLKAEGNHYYNSSVTMQQISTAMHRDLSPLYGFRELREAIVEREDDVKKLLELLTKHRKVLITGIGGLGKTTLANICANKWVEQNEFQYAVFINLTTAASVKMEFCALSDRIFNIKTFSRNTVKEVYEHYNKYKSLFVLDNIEENGLLPSCLPPNKCNKIYVLGTSQFTELTTAFELYPLGTFTDTASFKLIKQIFTNNIGIDIGIDTVLTQRVENIIKILDNHPLALQHATAFITAMVKYGRMTPLESLDQYINQINQQRQNPPPDGLLSEYRRSIELIPAGANVQAADASGDTPLHWAARHGDGDLATELILTGANVQAADAFGDTPLHCASSNGHGDIVTELILAGANVQVADASGDTPLHWAASNGHGNIVTELILAGANVQVADASGDTPLHCAASNGHSDIATELIRAGATVNIVNMSGRTPLDWARERNDSALEELLIKHGDTNSRGQCIIL